MPYTINHYNGNVLIQTINDGFADNSTSLTFPGPNYVGYGQYLNQNLVYLLENFAGNTAPGGQNVPGQLWFNTQQQTLNVFTSAGYVPVSGVIVSNLQPAGTKPGDTWFNTGTSQFYLFDGTDWNLIGPAYTRAQGISGAVPVPVVDTLGTVHNILQLQYGNVVIATVSGDPTFAPASGLSGFTLVKPGITFNSSMTASINTNIVGTLTGNVVAQSISGTLTGPVFGNLTGDVVGNLTGNVVATTLVGSLTGNVQSSRGQITNFSTANAVIAGGYITVSNVTTLTLTATNLSTANAVITGGTATGLANISATTGSFSTINVTTEIVANLRTGNAQITGGNSSVTNATSVNETATNFSTGNALITGGNVNGLTNLSAATASFQNLTTTSISISSGSIAGLTNLGSGNATITNFSTGNAQVTGGTLANVSITTPVVTRANLVNAIANTPATNDRTANVATTAFVHNVMPTGMIIMWGGLVSNIPSGWHLCDGTGGTPDLQDRFIVGAGNNYNVGDSAGQNTTTLTTAMLPSHNHFVTLTGNTNTAGSHSHGVAITDNGHAHVMPGDDQLAFAAGRANWSGSSVDSFGYDATSVASGGGRLWNTTTASTGIGVSINTANDHLHSLTISGNTASTGAGTAFDNRPPYYALCFLQKVY